MSSRITDRAEASARVRKMAFAAGFHKVGIVRAERLEVEGKRFQEWLSLGYEAGMSWLRRDSAVRSDPRKLLKGARTVVAVAMNYYTPPEHRTDSATGKISRYAWGDDYHYILKERLFALLEAIKVAWPDANGKVCVDTAPVMDKAWAVRAGIGWLGKHTNVITMDHGSWVFLGEILLDIELEPDGPVVEDHCGSCTACLDACPTGAIVEPYLVDSNKCISYATIEHRGDELPEGVEGRLDGWLYGCDICQDVCPWNRFSRESDEIRFAPRPGNVNVGLREILEMDHDQYVDKFRRSAVKRAKLTGLKRNAKALSARSNPDRADIGK